MNIKPFFKTIIAFGKKHSTKILAGSAIISEAIGFWFMHKKAPIVKEKIDQLPPDATTFDKLKVAAPLYLPAALMFITSSGCIIGGCAIGEAKLAAMTNLAMATDAALTKYEQKMIDTVGKENAQKIHDEIAKDLVNECPPSVNNTIATTHGTDLFFDPYSGRYFTSSASFIQKAVANINLEISSGYEMWQTVNDWYSELDIPTIKLGGLCGWGPDNKLEVEITGQITEDGKPYGVLSYYKSPRLHNNIECSHVW